MQTLQVAQSVCFSRCRWPSTKHQRVLLRCRVSHNRSPVYCSQEQWQQQDGPSRRDVVLLGTALSMGLASPTASHAEVTREAVVQTFKSAFAARAQGDRGPLFDLFADNVKFTVTWTGEPITVKGKAAIMKLLDETIDPNIEVTSFQPIKFYSDGDGDEVAVVIQLAGVARKSKKPFKTWIISTYVLNEDGKVFLIKDYTDTKLFSDLLA